MQDKDVTGTLSKKQLVGLIRGQFIPKQISTNNKFLMRIKKNNPSINLGKLRTLLSQIEKRYMNADIRLDVEKVEVGD